MDTICREYIKQTQMLFPIIRKKERIYLKSLYNDLIEYCDINKISNLQELFMNTVLLLRLFKNIYHP